MAHFRHQRRIPQKKELVAQPELNMSFLEAPEVLVRCLKCGNERKSYNDPRSSTSVIECKAKCFESHREWEFVRVLAEAGSSATAPPGVQAVADHDSSRSGSPVHNESRRRQKSKTRLMTAAELNEEATVDSCSHQDDGASASPRPSLIVANNDDQPLFHIVGNGASATAPPARGKKETKVDTTSKKDETCCRIS